MVATCLHLTGFVASFVGWIGLIVATSTNDWVVTCGYTITTCRKMDELGSKGLWADCVMATGLYHCKPLVDILILPGYVQACRALMIAASVLGLPAVFLLVTVLPCIRMGNEPGVAKYRRSQLGGILLILLVCLAEGEAEDGWAETGLFVLPCPAVGLLPRQPALTSCLIIVDAMHACPLARGYQRRVQPQQGLHVVCNSENSGNKATDGSC
ncbi:UNVERIFIED_CONTAM: Claudin-11 [Gekko kuhli]